MHTHTYIQVFVLDEKKRKMKIINIDDTSWMKSATFHSFVAYYVVSKKKKDRAAEQKASNFQF